MTLGEKEQEFLGALRVSMPATCNTLLLLLPIQVSARIGRPLSWIPLVWSFIYYRKR